MVANVIVKVMAYGKLSAACWLLLYSTSTFKPQWRRLTWISPSASQKTLAITMSADGCVLNILGGVGVFVVPLHAILLWLRSEVAHPRLAREFTICCRNNMIRTEAKVLWTYKHGALFGEIHLLHPLCTHFFENKVAMNTFSLNFNTNVISCTVTQLPSKISSSKQWMKLWDWSA